MKKVNNGFTLIELLVVIGIIAILAAIVIVSINPAKRFQDARQSQRQANVESILNAIQQETVDNKGITTCPIPSGTAEEISDADADLAACLSDYLAVLPIDPQDGQWTDATDYDTGYFVVMDATTKQVTVSAPGSEVGDIEVTR